MPTIRSLIAKLESAKKQIATKRDKLRELISEAEGPEENCTEAIESIERPADALSETL